MGQTDLWRALAATEKQIANVAEQVRRQRQVVVDSQRLGYDAASAKEQLALFEKMHAHLVAERDRLRVGVTALSTAQPPALAGDDWDPEHVLALAGWYRFWAQMSNSDEDRANRLSFAEHLEQRARDRQH